MGSSEESGTNSKLKHVTKDVRESKIYSSEPYQDFSYIIRTKKYLDEEYALMNEIITSMTIFHSYMNCLQLQQELFMFIAFYQILN